MTQRGGARARDADWERLSQTCDLLVVGGGVTGAGVLLEAARRGLRTVLVERGDFASGTSSRSSKLVHGGLRYLAEGRIALTRESVREREALLQAAPGLVDSMPFMMPHYRGRRPGRLELAAGLALYDAFAGRRMHRFVDRDEALRLAPSIDERALTGAHLYEDAVTDDARLVLRLLQEARDVGGIAVNYAEATSLVRRDGAVVGACVADRAENRTTVVSSRAVINATGVYADALRGEVGGAPRLRPLRGSHVILPDWRLPLAQAVAFAHPSDGRPVFAYPWLGATLVGTTDVDHREPISHEPSIAREEFAYLLDAVRAEFPRCGLRESDVLSTYAGIRPVLEDGRSDPSKAGRGYLVLRERGLVTVTGGKLTTFRPMALHALRAIAPLLAPRRLDLAAQPVFAAAPPPAGDLPLSTRRRLAGRFGARARDLLDAARDGETEAIGSMPALWAELRWSARNESVVRLEDLLLRRTRIGLLARDGAAAWLPRIRAICLEELAWDEERMQREETAYAALVRERYGLPA